MKNRMTSNLLLLLTAIIWGFAFVAQVEGTKHIGSFTMIGIRFLIATVSLLPVMLIFEKGKREKDEQKLTVKASAITGAVLFFASTFQQIGIQITASAGISGFITGLYMIFVPFVSYLVFKNRVKLQVWIGALFALMGLVMLCYKQGEGFSFGLGELFLLIGALFWTAHVMLVDHYGKKVRSIHFSCGQFLVSGVLGTICALLFEQITLCAIIEAKWSILYCGIFSSGVAYTLQVIGQKKADPSTAVIIMSTESAFSAIGGVIFGIDTLSFVGVCGCVLMFAGIICSQLTFNKKEKKGIQTE